MAGDPWGHTSLQASAEGWPVVGLLGWRVLEGSRPLQQGQEARLQVRLQKPPEGWAGPGL